MITDISNNFDKMNNHEYCYNLNYSIPYPSNNTISNNIINNDINYNDYNYKKFLIKQNISFDKSKFNTSFYDNINLNNDDPHHYENIVEDFLYSIDQSIEHGDIIHIKNSLQKYKNILPPMYIKMAEKVMLDLTEEKLEEMALN